MTYVCVVVGAGAGAGADVDVGAFVVMVVRVVIALNQHNRFSDPPSLPLRSGWKPQPTFSAVKWKDTEEAKELQSCLVWNIDPASEHEETPSFFSVRVWCWRGQGYVGFPRVVRGGMIMYDAFRGARGFGKYILLFYMFDGGGDRAT